MDAQVALREKMQTIRSFLGLEQSQDISLVMPTVCREVFFPLAEVATRLDNGFEVAKAAPENKHLECRKIVKEEADTHDMRQFLIRKVLVEHGEIVSEIKVGLHRIAFRKGTSTYMIHHAIGNAEAGRPSAYTGQQRSISSLWAKNLPSSPPAFQ